MRYLVTGGTGFIGRALCASLGADGHEVVVLTRRARAPSASGLRYIARLQDLDHADAVINLQGENLSAGRWTEARKQAFRSSRVAFTAALVDWMRTRSRAPAVLVSGSAIGWYGDRGDELLTEASLPGADFAAQLCRDWEDAALAAAALGVRVCRVRTGIVLDPDGGALAKMLTPFRLGLGGPLGDGAQWMSWITRHDHVRLLRWLVDHELHGVFNGTAPTPVRNRAFVQALGRAVHRPAVLPMPALALRAMFGEMSSLLLGSQRVLPDAARAAGFRFEHPGLADALDQMLRRG
jgi:uncharacterized protein